MTTVRSPIKLARAVMEHSPHVMLAGAGAAQARDVNWSVGVGVPGVVIGASNGYYAPAPVYVAPPPPVYYAPPRPG